MHAFLIGVYKDPEYLSELICSLDTPFSMFYIHINKKNKYLFANLIIKLKDKKNVIFVDSINVNWGGLSFLESITIMYSAALENKNNKFFHLLTGQDALARPINELFNLFSKNPNAIYLESFNFPNQNWLNGGIDRYYRYNFFDVISCRGRLGSIFNRFMIKFQKVFLNKRSFLNYENLYCGPGWWSMGRSALEYVNKELDLIYLSGKLKYTFAADELIFQTILLNSKYSKNVINNNLRFQFFELKNASPTVLDINHLCRIKESGAYFIRKVDKTFSRVLLDNILK